jgi:hypothetical protein
MAFYNSKQEHEIKWRNIDLQLNHIGFWVKWQFDYTTVEYKYAIGLKGEKQPMGIYNDEDTATAMAKMLWTNANDGG